MHEFLFDLLLMVNVVEIYLISAYDIVIDMRTVLHSTSRNHYLAYVGVPFFTLYF